jgi:hypothetical protein
LIPSTTCSWSAKPQKIWAAFTDVLPLADADLGSLMDVVDQQDDIDNILKFAYRKLSRANSLIGCVVLCNNNNNNNNNNNMVSAPVGGAPT